MRRDFMEFQRRVYNIGGHFAQLICRFDKDLLVKDQGEKYAAYVFDKNGGIPYSVIARVLAGTTLDEAELTLALKGKVPVKVTWENIAETYREHIEKIVTDELKTLIQSEALTGVTKDGVHYIEKWEPDPWNLSRSKISYILDKGEEFGSYWAAYNECLAIALFENDDVVCQEFDELESDVLAHLSDEAIEIIGFADFDFSEYLQEHISFSFRPEDWNQTLRVNLMIDSGNYRFDKNCDDLLNPSQPKDRLQYSSVLYVAGLLGKRTMLEAALGGNKEAKKDPFVTSVIEELENNPYPCGSTMTFLVTLSLHEMLDLLDAKHDGVAKKVKVREGTMCGLYNDWDGSGSLLEVKITEDLEIPVSQIEFQIEETMRQPHQYTVDQVYGLVKSAWTKAEVM